MIRYPRLLNPGTANEPLAREFAYWMDNHGYLDPFYRHAAKFIAKGTYDETKAEKLFLNAANRYYKTFARDQHIPVSDLNVPTRKVTADIARLSAKIAGFIDNPRSRRSRNCVDEHGQIEHDKWIPAHAVRFNKDGSVSMMR